MDPFELRELGDSGVRVTRLGFGAAEMGGLYAPVDEDRAIAAATTAWDLGIRYFDVAPLYGLGLAERRLGRFLSRLPRDEFVLSTKVGRLVCETGDGGRGAVFDFSADGVWKSLEASLGRLELDAVDIVYIHDPDDYWVEALEGAYPAIERMRAEGVVRAIGAGMNQASMLQRFAVETDMDVFLLAGRYTLLDQEASPEFLQTCVERGMSVIVGGIMNSGILADSGPGAHFNYLPADRKWIERADRIRAVCARHGVSVKAPAAQFPLAHPAVAGLLIGSAHPRHVAEYPGFVRCPLPGSLWADLRAEGLLPTTAPVP